MFRVRIFSRAGNRVLEIAGALYAISGLVLLGWFVVDSWGAAGLIDRGLQMLLIGAVIVGIWFIYIARVNLTATVNSRQPARQHRESVEALT